MTKYRRDEFDRVPESSTRQGVHRAAAEPRPRSLAPVLTAGVVALLVGLAAFLFLPKPGVSTAGGSSAVTAEQSAGPGVPPATGTSAPGSASAPGSVPAAGGDPAPSGSAAGTPSPGNTPEDSAAVDKTQPVAVYNASGTPGLASRVGAAVAADGWTPGPLANWGGAPQQRSVIFYGGAGQKPNAEALAALLGIPALVDSAEFSAPLVVVLGPGFR